jgi:hypothetical protein
MDCLRSSLVHRIRKEIPSLVLHDYGIVNIIHDGIFGTPEAVHNPRLQSLLGYNEAHHTYDILAPFLYMKEDVTNPEGLFRVTPLMLVSRLLCSTKSYPYLSTSSRHSVRACLAMSPFAETPMSPRRAWDTHGGSRRSHPELSHSHLSW